MLSPINLEPVHKRNWHLIMDPPIGTIIWPINVPYQITKPLVDYLFDTKFSGRYDIPAAISTPLFLKDSFNELVNPSIKGVGVSNIEELLSEGILLDGSDGVNPAIHFGYDKNANPDFFGDSSSLSGKKGYISLVFPDELILEQDKPLYPADSGGRYEASTHFLKVDTSLKEELYSLVEKEGVLDLRER